MMKFLCLNHRAHLVETLVQNISERFAARSVDGLFSMASFFRMGSFYIRMVSSVYAVLRDNVIWDASDPPEGAHTFAKELMDHAVSQRYKFKRAMADKSEPGGVAKVKSFTASAQKYRLHWEKHLELWTGPFENRVAIVVYTGRPLSNAEKEARLSAMSVSFIQTSLSSVMTMPEHGKWTKYTPALEWANLTGNTNGMLERLVKRAGGAFEVEIQRCLPKSRRGVALPDAQPQRSLWHELAGSRLERTIVISKCRVSRISWAMQVIILEPLKGLTCLFLKCSCDSPSACEMRVLDFANDSFSLSRQVLQYFHYVGTGLSRRVHLLLGAVGFTSMAALMADDEHYEIGVFFTEYVRITSAATYRRVDMIRRTRPFETVQLGDGRLPMDLRKQIFQRVVDARACCRGTYLDNLLGPGQQAVSKPFEDWTKIFLGWGRILEKILSIAGLERKNRLVKALVTKPQMSYPSLAAMMELRELKSFEVRRQVIGDHIAAQLGAPTLEIPPEPPKPKRGMGPLESYFVEKFHEEREAGQQMNALGFTSAWRRQQSINFRNEAPDNIVHHKDISDASKALAKEARKEYRAATKNRTQFVASLTDECPVLSLDHLTADRSLAIPDCEAVVPFEMPPICGLCRRSDWHPPLFPFQGMATERRAGPVAFVPYEHRLKLLGGQP
jgi:hypothetical protein